jgi:histidinol phosphatase-like enzyme
VCSLFVSKVYYCAHHESKKLREAKKRKICVQSAFRRRTAKEKSFIQNDRRFPSKSSNFFLLRAGKK